MPSIGTSHGAPGRARRDVFVRESVGETRFPFHRSAKVARDMDRSDAELFTLRVGDTHTVSGLLSAPPHPRACYVLAHGPAPEYPTHSWRPSQRNSLSAA